MDKNGPFILNAGLIPWGEICKWGFNIPNLSFLHYIHSLHIVLLLDASSLYRSWASKIIVNQIIQVHKLKSFIKLPLFKLPGFLIKSVYVFFFFLLYRKMPVCKILKLFSLLFLCGNLIFSSFMSKCLKMLKYYPNNFFIETFKNSFSMQLFKIKNLKMLTKIKKYPLIIWCLNTN